MAAWRSHHISRRSAMAVLTGGMAVAAGACSELFPNRFRFRTTVEVGTPQGLRTGSGVMEITAGLIKFRTPDMHAVSFRLKAETVAIDLPGGVLFMLITKTIGSDDLGGNIIDTFDGGHPREKQLVDLVGELGRRESLGRTAQMPPEYYPAFVHFRDIRNARTIEFVDPADLAKTFGAGVKLRRILLTVVDEPITRGTIKRLPNFGPTGFAARASTKSMEGPITPLERVAIEDFTQGSDRLTVS